MPLSMLIGAHTSFTKNDSIAPETANASRAAVLARPLTVYDTDATQLSGQPQQAHQPIGLARKWAFSGQAHLLVCCSDGRCHRHSSCPSAKAHAVTSAVTSGQRHATACDGMRRHARRGGGGGGRRASACLGKAARRFGTELGRWLVAGPAGGRVVGGDMACGPTSMEHGVRRTAHSAAQGLSTGTGGE